MKLLTLARLLMFTAAASGMRSYAKAQRNATAADSPARALFILLMIDGR